MKVCDFEKKKMIKVTFSQLMERSKYQKHQQQPEKQVSENEYGMTRLVL